MWSIMGLFPRNPFTLQTNLSTQGVGGLKKKFVFLLFWGWVDRLDLLKI